MGNKTSKKILKEKLLPAAEEFFQRFQSGVSVKDDCNPEELQNRVELSRSAVRLLKRMQEVQTNVAFKLPTEQRPLLEESVNYYNEFYNEKSETATVVSTNSSNAETTQLAAEGLDALGKLQIWVNDSKADWAKGRDSFGQLAAALRKAFKLLIPVGLIAMQVGAVNADVQQESTPSVTKDLPPEDYGEDPNPFLVRSKILHSRNNHQGVVEKGDVDEMAKMKEAMALRQQQAEKARLRLRDEKRIEKERQRQAHLLAQKERFCYHEVKRRLLGIEKQKLLQREELRLAYERQQMGVKINLREGKLQEENRNRQYLLELEKRRLQEMSLEVHGVNHKQAEFSLTNDWEVKDALMKQKLEYELEVRREKEKDLLRKERQRQAEFVNDVKAAFRDQQQTQLEKLRGKMDTLIALSVYAKKEPLSTVPHFLQPSAMSYSWLAAPVGDPHYFHFG